LVLGKSDLLFFRYVGNLYGCDEIKIM
jgi:hypothetical protein